MPGTQKKAEPRTPHLLSLNQDIVAWSQEEKCGVCNVNSQEKGRGVYMVTLYMYSP
jgi:hypothetical protein